MPWQGSCARLFPSFSRLFLGCPASPQESPCRPQARPHFHRHEALAVDNSERTPRGVTPRRDGRRAHGVLAPDETPRERRRALASMSCKGPSVDRFCDTSGRPGFASGPSG